MNSSLPLVEVFILSYNRPEYILQAIESALNQTYNNLSVIVSDNSSTNEVEDVINVFSKKDKITYVRRKPSLPALTHFNTIFSEATTKYFMVFHDDDVLLPDAISHLVATLEHDTEAAAVGGNALIIEEKKLTNQVFDSKLLKDLRIFTPEVLAEHYLDSSLGHVPFPSYLYCKSKIESLHMNFKEGQKHADVSFLIKACKRGPIVWLKQTMMQYRRHSSNDSISIDVPAVFSLCRFLKKNTQVSDHIIRHYKLKNYALWAKQKRSNNSKSLSPWRDQVITKSSLVYTFKNPQVILKAILKRLTNLFAA